MSTENAPETKDVSYALPAEAGPKCVLMTPDMAKALLKRNTTNRSLSEYRVKLIAEDIKNGEWKVTGDPIKYNDERVIDGQHRLQGIIRAGIPVPVYIFECSDPDVADVTGEVKPWNAPDTLKVMGFKDTNRLASALALVHRYSTRRMDVSVRYRQKEIKEIILNYPDLPVYIKDEFYKQLKGLTTPSVVDASYYLFSKKDPLAAELFMNRVASGTGVEAGDPELLLRNVLINQAINKGTVSNTYLFALYVKAWNMRRTGKFMKKLAWKHNESFPQIL